MKANKSSRRNWLVMMLLLLGSTNLQPQQQAQALFASDDLTAIIAGYPNPARYTVMRNGKPIGEHVLSFSAVDSETVVRVNSAVKVRFLGIPVYSLSYISEERWVGNELVFVSASTVENGSSNTVTYDFASAEEHASFASNHWHPGVVFSPRIFNTLTGEVEQVDVSPAVADTISVGDGAQIEAFRFTYNYEPPVDSWYDRSGLWLKMRFTRDDGSEIEYVRND